MSEEQRIGWRTEQVGQFVRYEVQVDSINLFGGWVVLTVDGAVDHAEILMSPQEAARLARTLLAHASSAASVKEDDHE